MHGLYQAILILVTAAIAVYAVFLAIHGYFMMRNRVPYVRLPWGAMAEVESELGVNNGDKVLDLGCGDGRVLTALSEACPGASYTGIENDWMVWLGARLRTSHLIKLVREEISAADMTEANKVFVYLGPKLMAELEPRFEMELPAGARVVSVQFALPNRKPDKVVVLSNSASHAACLYVYNY
ncbi:MAG: protein-lysine N-methyltransferase [Candidatus Saccharimonadales bacterium]